ncbi:flagellar hook-basal body protein FliE [Planctomycetes bacterium Poly30]|uniref:Flagellar hook-basal body complex protein FliE n=1 Tax=Saltatorellus ferox TaxID=2528018 RepID=A0A518ELM2_9BACT|nr:flagellar hook-basal body protein FliE [Planctomycetes bacterium Poly30]
MVNGIGGSGAGRTAIDAALKAIAARSRELGAPPDTSIGGAEIQTGASQGGFAEALKNGVNSVEEEVKKANEVQYGALEGRLDLHEVAAQLKESEMTFQFALQVRNKLMDAYREVMRMSV